MNSQLPEKDLQWLQSQPSLEELGDQFPQLLAMVRQDIATLLATGSNAGLTAYLKHMSQAERLLALKCRGKQNDKKMAVALLHQSVRTRMAHLAVKQHLVAEATGIDKGKIRFNLINGHIAQKLLFTDGLRRKPVSMFWFRLLWPLLWQRRLLMPLVQPEGIYCFYSRELLSELVKLMEKRVCLEIAAGDGTLTRFLAGKGVSITATDDYSWGHEVKYPEMVVRKDAKEALREYAPEVVICSWPPAGNTFERHVFRTRNVQLYIVIGSRHKFAAGNWEEYQQQISFDFDVSENLSRLVLPPELDAAVYVFRRKTAEVSA